MRGPRTRSVLPMLLALVAACVLVAGCGGGGDDPKAEPRLSKRVYIERFNEVVADAPDIFVDVSQATKDPTSARPHLAALDALIDDIDSLRAPKQWSPQHDEVLAALREMRSAIDVLSRAPASKVAIVRTQVGLYTDARSRYEAAIRAINASR